MEKPTRRVHSLVSQYLPQYQILGLHESYIISFRIQVIKILAVPWRCRLYEQTVQFLMTPRLKHIGERDVELQKSMEQRKMGT
jgi:hypothetical protein